MASDGKGFRDLRPLIRSRCKGVLKQAFKHFGSLLANFYLFPTPGKTNERVPSQQGAPTTRNLTYREVSQSGCGRRTKFNPSVWGEGVERVMAKGEIQPFRVETGGYVSDKRHMAAILEVESPTTP